MGRGHGIRVEGSVMIADKKYVVLADMSIAMKAEFNESTFRKA